MKQNYNSPTDFYLKHLSEELMYRGVGTDKDVLNHELEPNRDIDIMAPCFNSVNKLGLGKKTITSQFTKIKETHHIKKIKM